MKLSLLLKLLTGGVDQNHPNGNKTTFIKNRCDKCEILQILSETDGDVTQQLVHVSKTQIRPFSEPFGPL